MAILGILSLQANDNTDVFLTTPVFDLNPIASDEALMGITTEDLELMPQWINGRLPKPNQVTVDGDTISLQCLYRAIDAKNFIMTIYVEYEETEESSKEE